MAYKNSNHVRDERLYSYINYLEMVKLKESMDIANISQTSTAVRQFVLERSEQILLDNNKQKFTKIRYPTPTVHYQLPDGNFTVVNINSKASDQHRMLT